jgi:hypothetical protein
MRLSTLGNYKVEVPSAFTFVGSCVMNNSNKKEEVQRRSIARKRVHFFQLPQLN